MSGNVGFLENRFFAVATLFLLFLSATSFAYDLIVTTSQPNSGNVVGSASRLQKGAAAQISASPNPGFLFDKWTKKSGKCTITDKTAGTTTITMGDDTCLVYAEFKQAKYSLTASASEGGTATGSAENKLPGAQVSVSARPGNEFDFYRWSVAQGTCSIADASAAATKVTMGSSNCGVKAEFRRKSTYSLTVKASSGGRASGSAQGIKEKSIVKVAAVANDKYFFVGWAVAVGSCALSNANLAETNVTMGNSSCTVEAKFRQPKYSLTVTAGNGGSAQGNAGNVATGAQKPISARADADYEFYRWAVESGGCNITNVSAAFTKATLGSSNCGVKAEFARATRFSLDVKTSSSSKGKVSSGAAGKLRAGETTWVAASPIGNNLFAQWSVEAGNCAISSPSARNTTVTIGNSSCVLSGKFTGGQTYSLTVSHEGEGAAFARGNRNQAVKTGLEPGDSTDIKAVPAEDYEFAGWTVVSGGCTLSNAKGASGNVKMGGSDCSLNAKFVYASEFALVADADPSAGGAVSGPASKLKKGAKGQVRAAPKAGFAFNSWLKDTGNCVVETNTGSLANVTMGNESCYLRGAFQKQSPIPTPAYSLKLAAVPRAGGLPSGSSNNVLAGSAKRIRAKPSNDYEFRNWDIVAGNCMIADAFEKNTVVTMGNTSCEINAEYDYSGALYSLFLAAMDGGEVSGTVEGGLEPGETTGIGAEPSNGYAFKRWKKEYGACAIGNGSAAETNVTMGRGDCLVVAEFTPQAASVGSSIGPMPDLQVSNISIQPTLKLNERIYAAFTVRNAGNAAAGNSVAKYYVDGIQVNNAQVGSLKAGESGAAAMTFICRRAGAHVVSAYADALGDVAESNESNNWNSVQIECK